MLKDLKIETKIFIGFAITTLMFFIIAYIGSSAVKNINRTFDKLESDIMPGAIAMVEMKACTQETKARLLHYILVGDVKKICSIEGETSTRKLILETGDSLKKFTGEHTKHESHLDAREKNVVEELENKVERLNFAVAKIVDLKDRGVEEDKLLEEMDILFHPEFRSLTDAISQHQAVHMQELTEVTENISKESAKTDKIILVVITLILFLPMFIGVLISRSISNPIRKLQQGVKIIKKGNLNYKVGINSNNEVGQLSRDFDKMTDSLKKTRIDIEKKVIERTMELEKINEHMVDRELKMIELKKEIRDLKKELNRRSKI